MMMKMTISDVVTVLLLVTAARVVHCAIEEDLITDLPGLTHSVPYKQYSGYLRATGTRKLHYWFIESAGNPRNDPLVLWLNGGPGCSSMDGLLNENGPFRVASDGKTLVDSPYSWNKLANMLYLEAPAGVGYSYSDDKNYTTSDDQVSLDNYEALKYFLSKFSEYQQNEFFITGESYGGIYVPTLAERVAADKGFNFKGFAIGNAYSDEKLNDASLLFFGYYHGLFGADLWEDLLKHCCKHGNINRCNFTADDPSPCQEAINACFAAIDDEDLNIYNLYKDCYKGPDVDIGRNYTATVTTAAFLVPQIVKQQVQVLKTTPPNKLRLVPPCINVLSTTQYLNSADVRKALHIPGSLPKWEVCSGPVGDLYIKQYNSMKNQYKRLLGTKKYRLMLYNGDVDMACNFMGDEWFVDGLRLKPVERRKKWYVTDALGQLQVAGYVAQFEDLTFVTVKGSGHMVPEDKPLAAFEMISKFLTGQAL